MRFLERKFIVRQSEVDRKGKLRLDAFFDYMQDAASEHAAKLGCGMTDLISANRMWVLFRMRLGMLRRPDVSEEVTVRTWPMACERLFANREFRLVDSDGCDLAVASSRWLVLDTATLRPKRPGETLDGILPDNSDMPRFFTGDTRLSDEEGLGMPVEFVVRESGIDVNRHFNNARCAAVVYDWLAGAVGEAPDISTIQIDYLHSSVAGDRLVTSGRARDGEFFSSTHGDDGSVRFLASGTVKTSD
ncbi:MAG: thioesterase [Victivallaceae bacterium]|nr:thioesterase [Victivallaceae bacterium]